MDVARSDQAEAEAQRFAVRVGRFGVSHREGGLGARERTRRQRGLERAARLVAIEPVLDARVGQHPVRSRAGFEGEAKGFGHARVAGGRVRGVAAGAHEPARLRAAGQEVGRGFGARAGRRGGIGAGRRRIEDLARAVSGEDFEQALPLRVVMRGRELGREGGAGRRVDAPHESVGNDERLAAPLRELLEEHLRGRRVLLAIGGQLARVDPARTHRCVGELADPPQEVGVGRVAEGEQRLDAAREPEEARALHHVVGEGGDRSRGQLVVALPGEDHVLVAEVTVGGRARLGPLVADVGDEVRGLRIARAFVALAQALDRLAPARCGEPLGMIVQREEIEAGAPAREVARVGGGMHALAAEQRQAVEERVDRVGGVDVEVAEEDALARVGGDLRALVERATGFPLRALGGDACRAVARRPGDLARGLLGPAAGEREDGRCEPESRPHVSRRSGGSSRCG